MTEGRRPGLLRRLGSPGRGSPRGGTGTGEEGASEGPSALRAPPGPRPESGGAGLGIEATQSEPTGAAAPVGAAGDGAGERARAGDGAPKPTTEAASSAPPTRARTSSTKADPAPLGLGALAITLLVFSLFGSGLLPEVGEPVVLGLAFAYGGVAQVLAGMWEFRAGSTFGATAFTSYGAFWLSLFVLEAFFADAIPAADAGAYVGWTLIAWAIFTTYMYVASVRLTGAVNAVFLLLAATLYLLGVGEVIGVEIVTRVGGFVGLVTAAAAGYASYATLTDEAYRERVLPTRSSAGDDLRQSANGRS